jgi:signal transduction histidine kinase
LGLSIVEAVAKLHHASLVFEKNQGQGAMVSLIFNQPKVDLQHVG